MARDSRLPILIFAAIVALIAIPFLIDHLRELRRPVLQEARIVTATGSDPVFREGRRRVTENEAVEAAVAIRVGLQGREGVWMAPVSRLEIDGTEVAHEETDSWPEKGFDVRVFWFSVESTNLGGILNSENAAERLSYRTFLAPEMGRRLKADRLPERHNDDHIGQQTSTAPGDAGTVRLYARVEVVEKDTDLRPLQVATSTGTEAILDADFPAVLRSANLGDGIDPSVGELFGLPGFEPQDEGGIRDDVTLASFGRRFSELVADRIVVSSQTLAAVAVSGYPEIDETDLTSLGTLSIDADSVLRRGRVLSWNNEVRSGDLLIADDHWWVLLSDNGNGTLDPADSILHCWGRPPERTTLFASRKATENTAELLRYGG